MTSRSSAILFVLFFSLSCGKAKDDSLTVQKSEQLSGFQTSVKLSNFFPDEKTKIFKAEELIRTVVMSEEFKEEILNHEFDGKKQFADNRGLSNEEIYQLILNASEKLSPGNDHEMDLYLVAYEDQNTITVGYTYPSTRKIWMNRKYFANQDATKITTNMMHEWLHKIGFEHDTSPTTQRRFSVPYSVGYLVARLAHMQAEREL